MSLSFVRDSRGRKEQSVLFQSHRLKATGFSALMLSLYHYFDRERKDTV